MPFLVVQVSWPDHAINKRDPGLLYSATNGVFTLVGYIGGISSWVEEERVNWGAWIRG